MDHIKNFHLPIRDIAAVGKGPTVDQIIRDLRAKLAKAFTTLGEAKPASE